jgi:hypothetical protein
LIDDVLAPPQLESCRPTPTPTHHLKSGKMEKFLKRNTISTKSNPCNYQVISLGRASRVFDPLFVPNKQNPHTVLILYTITHIYHMKNCIL